MTLLVESGEAPEEAARIAETVQAVTKLRGSVSRVPAGSLPDDGKLIEDRRKFNRNSLIVTLFSNRSPNPLPILYA